VITDFILTELEDLVWPPVEGKCFVGILYDEWLWVELWDINVCSKYLIELSEAAEAQLAEAPSHDFAVRVAQIKADGVWKILTELGICHKLLYRVL
jgi:hypothetical protein